MVNQTVIVTVRNLSKRLPHKPLKQIKDNVRVINDIVECAKKTNALMILVTNTSIIYNVFEEITKKHKVKIFRGSLTNKIKGWLFPID